MFASMILKFTRRVKYLDNVKRYIKVESFFPNNSEETPSHRNNKEILPRYEITILNRQYCNKNIHQAQQVYV